MKDRFRHIILTFLLMLFIVPTMSAKEKTKFDVRSFVFGHTGDGYCFHLTEINGKPVCVWLPVIVHSKETGWHVFSSKHVCELKEGETYQGFYIAPISDPKHPGKLMEISASGEAKRPFDLSFTRNAFGIFLVCGFMLAFFLPAAKKYKKDPMATPTKYQGLVEWLTYTVLDGIITPSIPKNKVGKFAPYLLTVFFFIFFCNLFGLIPFFPFGANVTGNLSITLVLAFCTYVAVNVFGNRRYWKDILWPDVPLFLKFPIPLMPVIEIVSSFTKPFALMIRLFANILAGHIVIMVLMALIFIIGGMYGAGMGAATSIVSIFMMVFMTGLECLVAYLQAYVFTMLSAIFIGMAQEEEKEEVKDKK